MKSTSAGRKSDDLFVETHYWPAKRGTPKATVVMTVSALEGILNLASHSGSVSDVPAVLRLFAEAAKNNGNSEPAALEELVNLAGEEPSEVIQTDNHTIPADAHSDDSVMEVSFDALPWFEQASDDEIVALAKVDWGGDQEADQVAIFCQDHNNDLNAMFNYIDKLKNLKSHKDMCGFECHVEEGPVMEWLRTHKYVVWSRIYAEVMDE